MSRPEIRVLRADGEQQPVTHEEVLMLVQGNRDRIRDLSNQVLTVCGFVLSAVMVVLFFILQDKTSKVPIAVPILFFSSVGSLIGSLVLAIYACLMPNPMAVGTRFELLDALAVIYHREYRRALLGVILLIAAIVQFCVGLAVFAVASL
jgi:hypothetical protein